MVKSTTAAAAVLATAVGVVTVLAPAAVEATRAKFLLADQMPSAEVVAMMAHWGR
jgi:hypothetical protein